MKYQFDSQRSLEASAYLIRHWTGEKTVMKLIKLLYLADRYSIQKYRLPITGDSYFGMKDGPVLSTVLNLLRGKSLDAEWNRCIPPVSGKSECGLKADPGAENLSGADIIALDAVIKLYAGMSASQLRRLCHDKCKEYVDPIPRKLKRLAIDPSNIHRAVKRSEEEIRELEQMECESRLIAQLFPA